MKVASWNINSVRRRQNLLLKFLDEVRPDILCLQETKCLEEMFPKEVFLDVGYNSYVCGQKSYNGVAILSKHSIEECTKSLENFEYEDARFISADIKGLHICSVYVPNGQSVGAPAYYKQKDFLENLKKYSNKIKANGEKIIIAGDFNVAPIDEHADFSLQASFICDNELRECWFDLLDKDLSDIFPNDFTWYDYRWPKIGARIDNILYDSSMSGKNPKVLKEYRAKDLQPSDHCPIVLELDSN